MTEDAATGPITRLGLDGDGTGKEERELYLADHLDHQLDDKLSRVKTALNAFIAGIVDLDSFVLKHPGNPMVDLKVGGLSAGPDGL
jgi:hypothetical protein